MSNTRRGENFICGLIIREIRLEKEEEIKEGIGSYFKAMFEESQAQRPNIASELFMRIDSKDNEGLKCWFLEEKVTKAILELGGDKVLGLDVFLLTFRKFY